MTQEKAQIEKLDGKSMDVVEHNIEQLKELFPEVFAEGKISFNKLQELLGNYVVEDEDHYNFTWHGKRAAGRLAQTPSTGTLRPAKDESVDWDTTQNLFIEGDNLEVLKLLQKSYHRQVKMIYIDPPYNTGNDFVYEDDFKDGVKNYLETTGQLDGEGKRKGTNSSSAGRYHTNWLNMMYPRLKLARNLLKDDGVIFISIGDDELDNLTKACHEIFGEENLVSVASRVAKRTSDKGTHFRPTKDYILVYAKNKSELQEFGVKKVCNPADYKLKDDDGRQYKQSGASLYQPSLDSRPNQRYYIEAPDGSLIIPPGTIFPDSKVDGEKVKPLSNSDKVWRWSVDTYKLNRHKLIFTKGSPKNPLVDENGEQSKWNIYPKVYLDEDEGATLHPEDIIYDYPNSQGTKELLALGIPFSFSKPSNLIKYLIEIIQADKKALVLDFFAGSGTTAHAVMLLNAEDGGDRNHISVQLPELTEENSDAHQAGYKNIADISKERIRRAAKKIKEDEPDYDGDLGFKVFKLDSSNIKRWEADFDTLEEDLLGAVDYIKNERSSEDVLYELLLKYCLDLTVPIETRTIAGKTVYSIGLGALVVCLEKDVSMDVVNGIGALKEELNPEIMRVVFKDEGFKDDVVKTNALQTLKRFGIEDIKSL